MRPPLTRLLVIVGVLGAGTLGALATNDSGRSAPSPDPVAASVGVAAREPADGDHRAAAAGCQVTGTRVGRPPAHAGLRQAGSKETGCGSSQEMGQHFTPGPSSERVRFASRFTGAARTGPWGGYGSEATPCRGLDEASDSASKEKNPRATLFGASCGFGARAAGESLRSPARPGSGSWCG